MAYFSNSGEGAAFMEQCARCKHGQSACPVFYVQSVFNYKACNNEVASAILNELVAQDGTCFVLKMAQADFLIPSQEVKP